MVEQERLYFSAEFESFTIKGYPFIKGRPNIQPLAFGKLTPGICLTKIGAPGRNGGETTSHRVDHWVPWIRYVGFVYVDSWIKGELSEKCLAFLLPPGGLKNSDGSEPSVPVYCLYVPSIEGYILRPNFKANVCRQYSTVFTLLDGTILQPEKIEA